MEILTTFKMSALQKQFIVMHRMSIIIAAIVLYGIFLISRDRNHSQTLQPPSLAARFLATCFELRPENETYQEATIQEPGLHCIALDFKQHRLYGGGHSGPTASHALLDVKGGEVTLDLMNHTLASEGNSSGITIFVNRNKGSAAYSKQTFGTKTKNVTIKNGVIDLRGLGVGVAAVRYWLMSEIDETVPLQLLDYENSRFTLDNLLIITDNIGVILEGDGNIIKNCIIKSGGAAAIMMSGPNGQITNNTIVLSNPLEPGAFKGKPNGIFNPFNLPFLLHERRTPKAAIALHQASGTLIKNNRIEVEGASATRHTIYLTDASKDVVIESNTIVGTEEPVTLVKGSTAILKNNVLEPRKPWWKF